MTDPTTVDELQPGDHACLTFSDADERLDVLAAFVRDGLDLGAKVVCFTAAHAPADFTAALVNQGVRVHPSLGTGQLEVVPSREAFLPSGSFDDVRLIDDLGQRVEQALKAGYPGVRITADMSWALRPVTGLEKLVAYEEKVTDLFAGAEVTAVCQYDRYGFDAVTLAAVTAAHSRAVAAVTYHDDAVLRICRQHLPPGVRIAGELDYRGLGALTRALGEALRLDRHLFLNLTQLRFIDVAAAGVILQTALGLRDVQRMTLACQQPVANVLYRLGAGQLAALRLVVRDVG